jgi:hypothetical protein
MQKLKQVASALEAVVLRPYYPVSALFRMHRDRDGLRIDFMGQIDGVQAYEGVRGRAEVYKVGGQQLLVANPADVTLDEQGDKRGKDLAVIDTQTGSAMTKQFPKKRANTAV